MEKFQRIVFREAAYCLAERGMDVSPSAYLAPYVCLTIKTTQRKMNDGSWTWREILRMIPALRHLDGTNPYLDEVQNQLLEAQR